MSLSRRTTALTLVAVGVIAAGTLLNSWLVNRQRTSYESLALTCRPGDPDYCDGRKTCTAGNCNKGGPYCTSTGSCYPDLCTSNADCVIPTSIITSPPTNTPRPTTPAATNTPRPGATNTPQPTTTQCGPGNCGGCCNVYNVCVSGISNNACGVGGAACTPCPAGTSCTNGTCGSGPPTPTATVTSTPTTTLTPTPTTAFITVTPTASPQAQSGDLNLNGIYELSEWRTLITNYDRTVPTAAGPRRVTPQTITDFLINWKIQNP